MAATFGEAALAGYGIGSRIEFLLIPLVFGIGAAMTSLVRLGSVGGGRPTAHYLTRSEMRRAETQRQINSNVDKPI